ncbi:MAG TPA: MltA domain-containing protein [Burkholderiaceae bacterium]|nr:MltA domain-containing protein [Burkholderiaceae bacterium]
MIHMVGFPGDAPRSAPGRDANRTGPAPRRRWRAALLAAILGALAACGSGPQPAPPAPPAAPAVAPPARTPPAEIERAHSRWVAVAFDDLPGWGADRPREWWPALLRGCARPPSAWVALCKDAARVGNPDVGADDAQLRAWLEQRLQAYRVEAPDGNADGLLTGYFEPEFDASRRPRGAYRIAIFAPPRDLASRRPYWTRKQIDTTAAAKRSLDGLAIAYLDNPLDALVLHIQGSGRLNIRQADGSVQRVRVSYAGSNDQPYKSVGRWLIEQGELQPGEASWPAIRAWAQRNPKRVNALLWSNPRYVFFREAPLPDPAIGPNGAQGVPLTPGRSVAVDPSSVPYGTPVWLASTEPLADTPLRRLVMAQDTGSAITGAVRADYFWGWGETAEQQAGRMKQKLRMWALWPRP